MSNLRLINETTVSSAVSTVSVTDVFSADFDIYKIVHNLFYESTQQYLEMRFINSSGSVISSSNYDMASLNMDSSTSYSEKRNTNESRIRYLSFAGDNEAETDGCVTYVFNPFSSSSYSFLLSQGGSHRTDNADTIIQKNISVLKQTNTITGFQLFGASGNIEGANIRTYGLRVDS